MRESPFFAPPGTLPRGVFRPRIQPASKQYAFLLTDSRDEPSYKAPIGTQAIWDILFITAGFARPVKGRYADVRVPYGAPEPSLPAGSDPEEFQPAMWSQMWVDGVQGRPAMLRELSMLGQIISLNAFHSLYTTISFKKEAQLGQLPVLRIHEFTPVDTAKFGTFGCPVLELVGFTDRDEDIFGPALIPPPSPMLPSSAIRPAQLANDNDGIGVSATATTPASKPANDPLAAFRPVSAKQPY